MKRIRTLGQLWIAAKDKKAVVTHSDAALFEPPYFTKPMPAMFMMNMAGSIILSRINAGLFIYEKKTKTGIQYVECPSCGWKKRLSSMRKGFCQPCWRESICNIEK